MLKITDHKSFITLVRNIIQNRFRNKADQDSNPSSVPFRINLGTIFLNIIFICEMEIIPPNFIGLLLTIE